MPVETSAPEEELHWLALRLIPGLGTRSAGRLITRFRTPQAVFRASRTELEGAGISGAVAQQEKMRQTGTIAVTIGHPGYPPFLREIFDPPIVLFARGRTDLLRSTLFGVVGTRRPT